MEYKVDENCETKNCVCENCRDWRMGSAGAFNHRKQPRKPYVPYVSPESKLEQEATRAVNELLRPYR